MQKIISDIETNRDYYLKELFACLKIPSISADSAHTKDVRRCGEFLVRKLTSIGLDNASLKETTGHPAVYADWMKAGKDKPTMLIYGHYDVQPAEPIEKWHTNPFEPTIKDGNIYGRGTCDDKAQVYAHISSVESILKTNGKLPVNVKFFLEGEEEGGSGGTPKFVKENKDLLSCDTVLISDTNWVSATQPTIIYALRGITYYEVRVKGPNRDLHSGSFGGMVVNPISAIAQIISRLHDENGHITIDGLYDDVLPLTNEEKSEFAKVGIKDDKLMEELGVNTLGGEAGYTSTERNWGRPALDVNGVWGGYSGEGSKTVITSEGGFKFSIRLVPNQTAKRTDELVTRFIKKITPKGVTSETICMHGGNPVMVPTDNKFIISAKDAIEKAFGIRPVLVREGASIPISATFLEELKAPVVFMGFALNDDCPHSPNEKYKLSQYFGSIAASAYFLFNAGKK